LDITQSGRDHPGGRKQKEKRHLRQGFRRWGGSKRNIGCGGTMSARPPGNGGPGRGEKTLELQKKWGKSCGRRTDQGLGYDDASGLLGRRVRGGKKGR